MIYHQFKPTHPLLKPHIEYYNSIQGNGLKGKKFISLPEGKVGIVFMLNGHTVTEVNQEIIINKTSRITGLIQQPHFIEISPDIFTFCAVFKPGGLYHLIPNVPVDLAARASITLEDLFGKEIYRIEDKIFEANTFHDKIAIMEQFLLSNLKPTVSRIKTAIQLIGNANNNISVKDLGHHLNLSTRQLRNVFNNCIGLSPKQFIRMMRFKTALSTPLLPSETLAQYASRMGCYDESHLIHEFKSFSGMTPRKYFNNTSFISDFSNYKRLMIP